MIKNNKIIVIAEAGVNHNGSIDNAKKLIDIAESSGADYVKFQTFKTESLVTKKADKAEYQKNLTEKNENQFNMIKKLELDKKSHFELLSYCQNKKVQFLSSAFNISSLEFLYQLGVPFFKIPSGEINNLPYLRFVASKKIPVVMSTGMSTMSEIETASKVLIQGGLIKKNLTILHCNTEYPTPMKDVNLRSMLSIKNKIGVDVGYSDHTHGIEVAIAAAALGATIIEKHFTIDRKMDGPDHSASLEKDQLEKMICSIRNIEKALGSKIKKPSESEKKNITVIRKSIVAKKNIKVGDIFSTENIDVKRPATGLSPMLWDGIIGKKSKYVFEKDEQIRL